MEADASAWLADAIGLPRLEEDDGALVVNDAAEARLQGERPTLAAAGAIIAGDPDATGQIAAAIADARAGESIVLPIGAGQGHLIAAPVATNRVRLIYLPASFTKVDATLARASSSELAASVTHELANALSAVIGWATRARTEPEERDEALASIDRCARTAHATARTLLDSHGDRPRGRESVAVDVAGLLLEVTRLLEPAARLAQVELITRPVFDVFVKGVRADLFGALWNLGLNAIQAQESGGAVTFAMIRNGRDVLIQVRDRGPGVPAELRSRIFDRYYTTKIAGTGLGLANTRATVESLGGAISVESPEDGGATFAIRLPIMTEKARTAGIGGVDGPAGAAREDATAEAPTAFSNTLAGLSILVVEDDDGVRSLIETALIVAGASPVGVATAAEAARAVGPFALALVDLILPDQRGDHLIAALRRAGTVVRAALVSGASEPPDLHAEGHPDAVLRKPFESQEVVALAERLVETAAAPGDDGES